MWEKIKDCGKPVLLYGMGNGADRALEYFKEYGIELRGVFASDEFVRGQSFAGFKVINYERAKKRFGSFCVVTAFGAANEEAMRNIERINEEQELYYPDMPLFGGEIITKEYLRKNRERIQRIYDKIADEKSKKTFENCLRFRLYGDIKYLKNIMVTNEEAFEMLQAKKNSSFADLGAYNGDTAALFMKVYGESSRILAIEPDKNNFRKLKSFAEGKENIEALNAAVSDRCGELEFASESSRNSHAGEGGIKVKCIDGDSVFAEFKPEVIKMDLEGHEAPAIEGMKKTIREQKPAIMAAVYHKTDDFLEIPERILELNPDYKLKFCKLNCYPCWDVFALFIK